MVWHNSRFRIFDIPHGKYGKYGMAIGSLNTRIGFKATVSVIPIVIVS